MLTYADVCWRINIAQRSNFSKTDLSLCFTHALLMLYSCFTHALLILYSYYTHALLMLYSYYTHALLMLYACFTHALLMNTLAKAATSWPAGYIEGLCFTHTLLILYSRFTDALLMLYWCFTDALLHAQRSNFSKKDFSLCHPAGQLGKVASGRELD
jgi:hypothetical protein